MSYIKLLYCVLFSCPIPDDLYAQMTGFNGLSIDYRLMVYLQVLPDDVHGWFFFHYDDKVFVVLPARANEAMGRKNLPMIPLSAGVEESMIYSVRFVTDIKSPEKWDAEGLPYSVQPILFKIKFCNRLRKESPGYKTVQTEY